jgi:hypothetical protein
MSLLKDCWVLRDSAFLRILRKIERVRKKSEYLPQNSARTTWQLELERFSSIVKLFFEWRIKDLKRSWLYFEKRLSTNDTLRRQIWGSILFLHNLRQRKMRIGQIESVFMYSIKNKDKEKN